MAKTFILDVVSAEASLFNGEAKRIQITGSEGELGIHPDHTPLLTAIKPGLVRIVKKDDTEELIYLSGGILEVQPKRVIVLSDSAIYGEEISEERALASKQRAEAQLAKHASDIDQAEAEAQLSRALAKLKVIELVKMQEKSSKRKR
ncbi:F0F1 ATP synthase subunit epsilon [Thorsellia kenyensis]|uniref:ATP synthase epsilon chain n=1 Tax=Thorsellia kenyensis TaxID=1549888 RepID=A0ABV6CCE8_9GAMM